MFTRRITWAVLLLVLTGCAVQPGISPAPVSWAEHKSRVEASSHWAARGKLALRTSERAESANLDWEQRGTHTRLLLSGPMGLSATSVESDGKQLEVRQGDERRNWDISSPDAVLRSTGWDLPVAALPHWVRGLPAPGYAIQTLQLDGDQALIDTLIQEDWEVRYEAYGLFDSLTLPIRLRIQRGDTSARLIIRDWQSLPK